jgi:hypothetical protein
MTPLGKAPKAHRRERLNNLSAIPASRWGGLFADGLAGLKV